MIDFIKFYKQYYPLLTYIIMKLAKVLSYGIVFGIFNSIVSKNNSIKNFFYIKTF